ncbi:hypothetical protein HYE20_03205 [Mycoplasmopsis bovis]|nr:hypothetical protein [Mycoplasmopsis bovis]QQH24641.1 hypothetical protein HYE20_03205 [Mycoplasmopsis bovis]
MDRILCKKHNKKASTYFIELSFMDAKFLSVIFLTLFSKFSAFVLSTEKSIQFLIVKNSILDIDTFIKSFN